MNEKTINNLIEHIFLKAPELKDKLVGCSEKEVKRLEEKFNLKLPEFYKDFLLRMGNYAGGFLRDEYYEYKELMGYNGDSLNEYSRAILRETYSNFILPNNAFVFLANPEGAFWYFLCEEKENIIIPNVYFFLPRGNRVIPESLDKDLYDFFIEMIY